MVTNGTPAIAGTLSKGQVKGYAFVKHDDNLIHSPRGNPSPSQAFRPTEGHGVPYGPTVANRPGLVVRRYPAISDAKKSIAAAV